MVSFAVLGCGRISEVHLKAVNEAKNARLVAVCDIVEKKARDAAAAYGVPYYLELEKMLKEQKPQAVIIGTPSGMHSDHAVICAAHGANVLCEKPLDITKEKIDRMISACARQGVKLGGIYQRRTYRGALEAKKAIEAGLIGKPVLCDGYFKYSRTQEYYDADDWRGTWELDGGGALMNQCIHGIDLLLMLCGEIETVTAKCVTLARSIPVEDTAVILVKYKSGAVGVIEAATSLFEGEDTVFQLHGTEGTIAFGDDRFYKWQTKDGAPPPEISDSLGGKNCGWAGVTDGHRLLVEDMAECVTSGKTPVIPPGEARRAVDVILAIYKSSETNREVKVYD